MTKHVPRMNNEVTEDELYLRDLLSQPGGFERYASEKMPEFIQVERDYEGFVRDIIFVSTVTPEDLVRVNEEVFVVYSKDVDATAATISRHGEVPSLYVKGDTVKVTFFPLTTPRLTITQWELDTQPYDLMKRTQEKAGQAMAKLEDQTWLDIADMLMDKHPEQTISSTNTEIQKIDLISVKKIFSRNNVAFAGYLMNPTAYDDFLLWGEDELDEVSQRTVLETGQLPTIWGGIQMWTGLLIPEEVLYGLSPKEVLGRMPILRDVTLEVNKIPETFDKEVLAYEHIGMYIHSHKTIVRLTLGN